MPYPYPQMEGPALDQINQRFLDATVDVPQVPYGGVVEVGDLAVDLLDRGELDWYAFGLESLAGLRLRHAIAETIREHGAAGVPNNEGLRRSMPFAYELVTSGVVHGIHLLREGDDSAQTREILPVDPREVASSAAFLTSADNRSYVRGLFAAVRTRLARTDVPPEQNVVAELDRYRPAIADISTRYMGLHDGISQGAKQRELVLERDKLMAVAGPAIHEALAPFAAERAGVRAFAGALACFDPSPQLYRKHFPETI